MYKFRTESGRPEQRIKRKTVIPLVAAGLILSACTDGQSGHATAVKPARSTATSPAQAPSTLESKATFVFDSLHSTASNVIQVYPGVHESAYDKTADGTFMNGQTAPAVCRTVGRTVISDPSYGETPRRSDVWVRILGSPGVTQYATVTYGEVKPDLTALPDC